MSVSDPIADLLVRLRNASKAKNRYFDIMHSKLKESIVKILKRRGFVAHYLCKEENNKGTMRVFLKYTEEREEVVQGLKRVSKPSSRKYVSADSIPYIYGGMGVAILSTSKGVIEGSKARELNVGGELLCLVW